MSILKQILSTIRKSIGPKPYVFERNRFSDAINEKHDLAVKLHTSGELQKAKKIYEEIITECPEHILAYNNLAYLVESKGDRETAVSIYEKVLSIEPNFVEALSNLAFTQADLGLYDQSLRTYKKLIKLDSDPKWRWKMSFVLFRMGRFRKAWREYDKRIYGSQHVAGTHGLKIWDGKHYKDKKLFITPEQGIGDMIMFSACIPVIKNRMQKCILHCDKRLEKLFQRSYPDVIIHGGDREEHADWLNNYMSVEYEIPIMSLPRYCYPKLDRGNDNAPFLKADPERVAFWRSRMGSLNDKMKVGISWRGGWKFGQRKQRSLIVEMMGPILSNKHVQFVNAQYGNCTEDLSSFRKLYDCNVLDWNDLDIFNDIDDLAALLSALDLLITVDNSTAHLAGALGTTTWLLLPYIPEWRWPLRGEHSHWYPEMYFYRQQTMNKWETVIQLVSQDLEHKALMSGDG